ncbi:hypothetical protein C1645_839552 [Glomus cerebriforme]|uniref:Uncharacterized protein n=1 Tax=Glomus cerebriforme TaxID=658196 RepID=A0A397S394_9GLOM|nr:hypothetical protein C1645_839552 [Glomus cerebriforme]
MIKIDTNILTLSFSSMQNGPSQLCAYAAILLLNGIIVYIGGYKAANNINSIESCYLHSAILVSDVSSIVGNIPLLACHSADLIVNHITVAFGNIT